MEKNYIFRLLCYSSSRHESSTPETVCDVVIKQGGLEAQSTGSYKYLMSQTSTVTAVSPKRAGTGGGVTMTITGTGFSLTASDIEVTIDEVRFLGFFPFFFSCLSVLFISLLRLLFL